MKPKKRSGIIRVFTYLLKYKYGIILGIIFAIITSLANLVSLTSFVPIFNAIGSNEKIQIFEIGPEEKKIYKKYKEGITLETYEFLYVKWIHIKNRINNYFAKFESNKEIIFQLILFIIPIYLLKILSVILSIFFLGTSGFYAIRDLRNDVYLKLNRLNIHFFEQERSGYILSRVVNDLHQIAKTISVEIQESLVNIFYIITHLLLLIIISWKMLLVIFVVIPLLMTPVNRFALKIKRIAKNQQERISDMLSHLNEVIHGIRVIRAFAMEDFEQMRFNLINEKLYKDTFKGHYYYQLGPAITELVVTIVVVFFISWGAYEITNEKITKGHFFAFFFTLLFIMRPIIQTSIVINLMGVISSASDRVFEIFDNSDEISLEKHPIEFSKLNKSIQYKNIYFSYPSSNEQVLKDINLEIHKNEIVALVGESGSGKSTFVDLLLRFYDPIGGEILIDGINLKKYNIYELRRKVGIVPQNIFLFNSTVRENITLFDSTIPESKLIEVCKIAYAHDFISQFPNGYDTIIGERGVMLSGGQKQRIAIARALIRDPEILIFDEATSALDNESEKIVEEAIERSITNKTVIIIAHRLRTVYKANKIYVFHKGVIVESGTHEELLKTNGIYKNLYELQFSQS